MTKESSGQVQTTFGMFEEVKEKSKQLSNNPCLSHLLLKSTTIRIVSFSETTCLL